MAENTQVTDRLNEDAVMGESDEFLEALNSALQEVDAEDEPSDMPAPEPDDEAPEAEEQDIPLEDQPASSDGPTAEMLAVAKVAGVPDELLSGAKDNAAVTRLIDWFGAGQAAEDQPPPAREEPEADELSIKDLLGDNYDADDPAHKQLKHVVETVNKQREQDRRAIRLLLDHASAQLRERQQSEAMSFQKPYDEALDELGVGTFGDSRKGLTREQAKLRETAFHAYANLIAGEPPDRHKELAQSVIKAKFSHLFANRERQQQAREAQAQKRLGGRPAPSTPEPLNDLDAFSEALAAYSQSSSTRK